MPDFAVRVTRVRRVVQQADIVVSAAVPHEAEEMAAETDINGWVTIDAETQHRDETVLGIKVPGQAKLEKA